MSFEPEGIQTEPAAEISERPSLLGRAKSFYFAHEPACTTGFFVAGFLFDTLAVGRIDRIHNVIHQATYLILCAWFISLELRELYGEFSPPRRLETAWRYHKAATHFMLGTLLNIYTLFYFKSATWGASFLFLLILAGLLAVNEIKPFEESGTTVRMVLFSLCLISYFGYLVPMLVGSIGVLPFMGSLLIAGASISILIWRLKVHLPTRPQLIVRHIAIPFSAVAICFAVLYLARVIPPVPLSLSSIGIYHEVHWEGDRLALTMTRPRWKFWQRGDQSFLARPGDEIHCFVSVFSPTHFKERLQVRWQFFNTSAGKWQEADAIPLNIIGGRDGGYRGLTSKSHYQPGHWRIRVETSDRRELGSINLKVIEDHGTGPIQSRIEWR
jgi:hypothetical protein